MKIKFISLRTIKPLKLFFEYIKIQIIIIGLKNKKKIY